MRRQLLVVGCLLLAATAYTADRGRARVTRIGDSAARGDMRVAAMLTTADTCIVRHDAGIYFKIDGWVTGGELYKGFCDPSQSCANAYPFIVTEINMPMYFSGTPEFAASVDVELVDFTNPLCPMPGPLVDLSSEYLLQVPEPGLYNIWIPLDTPVTVTGPFFAGFYISTVFTEEDGASVVIDTVPRTCVAYNVWDTTIGFIDLCNNTIWDFPGRLVLYASGVPAGIAPSPQAELIEPGLFDTLFGRTEIWVRDLIGSNVLDYAVFEYRAAEGGTYTEIGRDFEPARAFRDGSTPIENANGFACEFNFGALTEGEWVFRATVYDTLGRYDRDSVTVFLDPTPPIATAIGHGNGDAFCGSQKIQAVCPDEDLDFVQGFHRQAQENYSAGIAVAGPPAHGAHWCAPYAAAMAIELWYDRGITRPMTEYSAKISIDTLAARLAARFETVENSGTYDDDLIAGLREYVHLKGDELEVDYRRNPDYFEIRNWAENSERGVMLGLSGAPGTWVVVDGFSGWLQVDGSLVIKVANPLVGAVQYVALRHTREGAELNIGGTWRPIDIMVSVSSPHWIPSRTLVGTDIYGADGWTVPWTPSALSEEGLYHVDLVAHDAVGMSGTSTVLMQYNCSLIYLKGDYNNDGELGLSDAQYLMRFIVMGGSAPIGGAGRADANCDGYVTLADVVYFLNYLFGSTSEPCY